MHELSLCGSIFSIVDRAAAGRGVSVVHLQVGKLRQVVPDSLRYCWTLVSERTPLAGSVLDIDSIDITLACQDCAAVSRVEHELILICAECGSRMVTVATGEEFFLTSFDLTEA